MRRNEVETRFAHSLARSVLNAVLQLCTQPQTLLARTLNLAAAAHRQCKKKKNAKVGGIEPSS